MIKRAMLAALLEEGVRRSPVTALLGPRQCRKTTLAGESAGAHAATDRRAEFAAAPASSGRYRSNRRRALS